MKKLLFFLLIFGLFFTISCNDDSFCIDDIAIQNEDRDLGNVNFTLPDGQIFEGPGLLPISMKLGEYNGTWQSVVTSETVTETGAIFESVHYFFDEEGNSFWSDDSAVFTNIGEIGKATSIYTLNLVDGRGDFECVNGNLQVNVYGDFIENKSNFTLTGSLCGGCE